MNASPILALCGGIGGAKLALGLYHVVAPGALTVVVNTGDDFEHLGLSISPDLDTVLYTLGGVADPERGWGRENETWHFMAALRELGGEQWFQLGDRDLALHVERTRFLHEGRTLTSFVAHAASRFGINARILPMTDDRVRTIVETDEGDLPFQRYFVERRCAPAVRRLRFDGAEHSHPSPGVLEAIADPGLRAIVICPSNPYLSVDPILAVPGIRHALMRATAPVIAVSPIIGGQAVKGPTVKIMEELGVSPTAASISAHYHRLIDGLIVDDTDRREADTVEIPVVLARTLMKTLDDRKRLAQDVIAFAETVALNKAGGVASLRLSGARTS